MYQGAVAFLIADDYADAEFRLPYDRVGRLGTFDVVVIGLHAGVRVRGRERTEAVEIEQSISRVRPGDFVGLVIPGGGSPDRLLADPRVVPWVSRFSATGHTLAAAAEGSAILVATGRARGRSIAAWPADAQRLASLGVDAIDEPVVRDGAWITSRHAGDTDAIVLALLQSLRHDEPASFEERHPQEEAPRERE